jgi:hypothetical protein
MGFGEEATISRLDDGTGIGEFQTGWPLELTISTR